MAKQLCKSSLPFATQTGFQIGGRVAPQGKSEHKHCAGFRPQQACRPPPGFRQILPPKLPPIHLSKFKGDILKYQAWRQDFEVFIINQYMSPEVKLQRLKSLLDGPPLDLIGFTNLPGFVATTEALTHAVKLLDEAYDIDLHDQFLLQFSKIDVCQKTDSDGLERLMSVTRSLSFAYQDKPIEYQKQFVDLFLSKLDQDLSFDFWVDAFKAEQKCPGIDFCHWWIQPRVFACRQARRRELFNPSTSSPPTPNIVTMMTSHQLKVCLCCGENHELENCRAFIGLKRLDRYKLLRCKNTCPSCLEGKHRSALCPKPSTCLVCQQKSHHTLLHTDFSYKSLMQRNKPKPCRDTVIQTDHSRCIQCMGPADTGPKQESKAAKPKPVSQQAAKPKRTMDTFLEFCRRLEEPPEPVENKKKVCMMSTTLPTKEVSVSSEKKPCRGESNRDKGTQVTTCVEPSVAESNGEGFVGKMYESLMKRPNSMLYWGYKARKKDE